MHALSKLSPLPVFKQNKKSHRPFLPFFTPIKNIQLQTSNYSPIRIKPHWNVFATNILINYAGNTEIQFNIIRNTQFLITSLISYISQRLSVKTNHRPISVDVQCQTAWNTNPQRCVTYSYPTCSHTVTIPPEHLNNLTIWSPTNHREVDEEASIPQGRGVSNTDVKTSFNRQHIFRLRLRVPSLTCTQKQLLLYISADTTSDYCGNRTAAWASSCYVGDLGRPIMGVINFCGYYLKKASQKYLTDEEIEHMSNIILHELGHVLWFSSNLYPLYKDKDNGMSAYGTFWLGVQ